MPEIYLGTSGWAYSTWKPAFYPAKTPAKKLLDHYAGVLNAVEVNYTFRAFPARKTLENWIAATPESFRFAIKANERITHQKRLRDCKELLAGFLNALAPLQNAGRMGPILFQLPPNMKADAELLDAFLSEIPNLPSTWEFREKTWFSDAVFTVLRKHNAALCIAESDDLASPHEITADFAYFRLRKPAYDGARLKEIAAQLPRLPTARVFAFFKHEETPEGALNALAVCKMIQEAGSPGP